MSASIISYPPGMRNEVIARRLASKTKGLGYWAAVDAKYRPKDGEKKEEEKKPVQ